MGIFDNGIKRAHTSLEREEDTLATPEEIANATTDDLIRWLKEGVVLFVYKKKLKKNQTVQEKRIAWGTKDLSLATQVNGGECPPKRDGYVTYFDLQSEGWRVFHPYNFVKVIKAMTRSKFERDGIDTTITLDDDDNIK